MYSFSIVLAENEGEVPTIDAVSEALRDAGLSLLRIVQVTDNSITIKDNNGST